MRKHLTLASTIALGTIVLSSVAARAASFEYDLTFSTTNQSIWATGDPFQLTDSQFLGIDWDESIDERLGIVGLEAGTSGSIGFQSEFTTEGGAVEANIPVAIAFTTPDESLSPGDTLTVQTDFQFGEDAVFTTTGPSVSYSLDLWASVAGFLEVSPGDALDIDDFSFAEAIPLIDVGEAAFELGELPGGQITVASPQVNTVSTPVAEPTNQLTAQGEETFAEAVLDLDALLTGGAFPLSGSLAADLGLVDVSLFYELFDLNAAASASLIQTFGLTGQLPTLLSVNGGPPRSLFLGESVDIVIPEGSGDTLDIAAIIDFDALFENTTELGWEFALDVLAGHFGIEIETGFNDETFEVGPLIQESFNLGDAGFTLFDESFTLGGFSPQTVSFSVPIATAAEISDPVTSVPEPGVLMGLFSSLLSGFLGNRYGKKGRCRG